jgi:hypothetical protein
VTILSWIWVGWVTSVSVRPPSVVKIDSYFMYLFSVSVCSSVSLFSLSLCFYVSLFLSVVHRQMSTKYAGSGSTGPFTRIIDLFYHWSCGENRLLPNFTKNQRRTSPNPLRFNSKWSQDDPDMICSTFEKNSIFTKEWPGQRRTSPNPLRFTVQNRTTAFMHSTLLMKFEIWNGFRVLLYKIGNRDFGPATTSKMAP